MSSFLGFNNLAPKTKNLVVAGGLTSFVFGVYFYTMRAVGGTDELQVAIDKFEEQKHMKEVESSLPPRSCLTGNVRGTTRFVLYGYRDHLHKKLAQSEAFDPVKSGLELWTVDYLPLIRKSLLMVFEVSNLADFL